MSTKLSAGRVRATYTFIKANRKQYSVQALCRILGVAPSGYYEWIQKPQSDHSQEDARLLRLIRASFVASLGVYGAPRVFLDLREAGETCSKHRVARLNLLQRQFTVTRRNRAWVTDITSVWSATPRSSDG